MTNLGEDKSPFSAERIRRRSAKTVEEGKQGRKRARGFPHFPSDFGVFASSFLPQSSECDSTLRFPLSHTKKVKFPSQKFYGPVQREYKVEA